MGEPATANAPTAAPIGTSAIQAEAVTWRATIPPPRPIRVRGTEETSPMENAVTVTRLAAARYAYPKLVTAPDPSVPAKGRQMT